MPYIPVPLKPAVVEAVEEVRLWSGGPDVWVYLEELEKGARSALLGADDDGVRQSTSSRRRRLVIIIRLSSGGSNSRDRPMLSRSVIDVFVHARPNIVAYDILSGGNEVDVIVRRRDDVTDRARLPERYHIAMT